jgi:predicted transglutaminase-like cysteine proteinase
VESAVKAMLAFAAALVAVPAVPQQPAPVPVDMAARAKFPRESGAFVDQIAEINAFVNANMQGVSDQEHYGGHDLWGMAPADLKGDCEDYSLTKIFMIEQSGVEIVSTTKLIGVLVTHKDGTMDGHAILAVRMPKGSVAYLDNLNAEPMTRKELVRQGYHFFDWRA